MLKNDVGYLIKSINDKLKVRADAELKQYHLTMSQSRVLVYLRSRGGQATQKEIETFLDVAHPTVVGLVSRMEQNGYVTCWPCEDGRNKYVKLTPQAEAIDKDMQENMHANEEMLLAPLSPEERERLRDLLLTVAEHLM
ncbi:MarR family winged helix-turn-helix transcriptional regulator [Faecalibacterium duncaniae]|uniref:MarR family winged helix-turn-helix transcriptional regulator n=1 Tax=Faecalibacterium duncaniae (strain DSM 17677 / JCM 31915 / A2-165) TaxID=411483 RepID=UPI003EDB0D89